MAESRVDTPTVVGLTELVSLFMTYPLRVIVGSKSFALRCGHPGCDAEIARYGQHSLFTMERLSCYLHAHVKVCPYVKKGGPR